DHLQAQALAQADDGAANGALLAVLRQTHDEALVHLENVQRKALQVAQRAIARAEIVQSQAHPQACQCAQVVVQLRAVFHKQAFSNFQHEKLRLQSAGLENSGDPRGESRLAQLAAGEVD